MSLDFILRFLSGRAGFIITHLTATMLVLTVVGTTAAYTGPFPWFTLAYGLLLSTVVLIIWLVIDLLHRYQFDQGVLRTINADDPLRESINLPSPATCDQELTAAMAEQLHRRAMEDQLSAQRRYTEHRRFMDLWVHQMKSPLATIRLTLQHSLAQSIDTSATDSLRAMDDEAQKLDDGLNMVLSMSRLTDFALDFHIEPVDLAALVRRQIHERKRQFIRTAIFPAVETVGAERFIVLTDAKWLGFVIDQLISNALKYGAQGREGGARLTFRLEARAEQISLAIVDQGPGIPPEDLPRIWEPFFTGQNGRRYAGATGIGLSLVKQVMDRLDHQIQVASEPGKGSTFTLTFRLTKL